MFQCICEYCSSPYLVKPSKLGISRFCGKDCFNANKKTPEIRFWRYVKKTDYCWEWTGSRDRDGYGKILNHLSAHRYSYQLHKCIPPTDLVVRHTCDNPGCVNPDHLILGTVLSNSRDMVDRGRSLRGERNHKAKLHILQVRAIRESSLPISDLALLNGVSQSLIYQIKRGDIWKD